MLPRLYYCRRHAAVPPYAIWRVMCSWLPRSPRPWVAWGFVARLVRRVAPGRGVRGENAVAGGPKETSVQCTDTESAHHAHGRL